METEFTLCDKIENYLIEYRSWSLWRVIILGQILSCLLCGLTYLTHYISRDILLHIPTGQNYLHYMLLCAVFTTILACRKGEKGLISVAKSRGYRYILIGFIDVQAKTLMATAHQFTTLSSIHLLDCIAIPVALALSCLILGVRFRFVHILGVSVSIISVGCLVLADIEESTVNADSQNQLVGDMLCLGGAVLFAVVAVLQELAVKTLDCIEYLGMLGLSGSLICGFQTFLLEKNTLTNVNWENKLILFYLGGFSIIQFIFYGLLAYVLRESGATSLQLYLLTADFYTLILGIILRNTKFHALYFLSFVLTMTGIYIFAIKKTPIAVQQQHQPPQQALHQQQSQTNNQLMINDCCHSNNERIIVREINTNMNYLNTEEEDEEEMNNSNNIIHEYGAVPSFISERFELTTSILNGNTINYSNQSDILTPITNTRGTFSSFYGN